MNVSAAHSPLDMEQLLNRCMGNIELAERVLDRFQQQFPDALDRLERSHLIGEADEVARVAHQFKGAAANLSAEGLRKTMQELEELGRSQRLERVPDCLDRARSQWSQFVNYVAATLPKADAD